VSTPDGQGIGIVLLNYCGTTDTLACLDSLLRSEQPFARLAICDNASPDGSLARLRAGLAERGQALSAFVSRHALAVRHAWAASSRAALAGAAELPDAAVLLIDNQDNRGFAAGNNVGLRWLQRDPAISHFWLLNNDTEVPPATLGALKAAVTARPEIDLWGGTVLYHATPDRVQAFCGGALNRRTVETRHVGAFKHRADVPRQASEVAAVEAEIDYALGACMVASRRWLLQAGLLCEAYFLYYEELDWATRGRRTGLRLGYAPEVVVLHKEGASIGTSPDGGSPLSVRHLIRSRVLYAKLHLGRAVWPTLVLGISKQVAKLLLRGRLRLGQASAVGLFEGIRTRAGAAGHGQQR
jgi:GT2 family glycosyltransferase